MSKRVKITIIVAIIFLVITVIIGVSSSSSSTTVANSANTGLSSSGGALGGAVAKTNTTSTVGIDDFSAALASIRSVSIDTSIFNDPAYKTLQDNPVILGTDVVGRVNPFAPVGTDAPDPSTIAPSQNPTQQISANGASITTGDVTKIKTTSAVFSAQPGFDPLAKGQKATVVFEYGTTDALGSVTVPIAIKVASPVITTIKKLTPATQYFVRATLVIGDVTVQGDIISFNTL
ncbi:MAG: hypothetical protein WCQ32_03740 [bacterium]